MHPVKVFAAFLAMTAVLKYAKAGTFGTTAQSLANTVS